MNKILRYFLLATCLTSPAQSLQAAEVSAQDFAFLAGMWSGEGFGGQSEEMWMPPSNGRVFGIFTQTNDGELVFTEYMEITEEASGWVLRLKHFNPDFSGWEEKEDYVTFRLESVAENKAVFGGLSYEVSGDSLTVSLRLRQDDGSITTEQFNFKRIAI
jgi:hypothetical protein